MEQLIKTIPLKNNLTLELFDASKKIAADRWQVTLKARMAVPVEKAIAESRLDPAKAAEIRQILEKPSPMKFKSSAILLMTGKKTLYWTSSWIPSCATPVPICPPGVCRPFCTENLS